MYRHWNGLRKLLGVKAIYNLQHEQRKRHTTQPITSPAFDTFGHSTLLQRLDRHFGISVSAFQWFKSDISTTHRRIHVAGSLSVQHDLHFCIPRDLPSVITCMSDPHKSLPGLSDCLTSISLCMKYGQRVLYADKVDIFIIGTKHQQYKFMDDVGVKLYSDTSSSSDNVSYI